MDAEYGAMMAGEALDRGYGQRSVAGGAASNRTMTPTLSSRVETMQKLAYQIAERLETTADRLVGSVPMPAEANMKVAETHLTSQIESLMATLERINYAADRISTNV